jgi:hypothetical protein
MTISIIETLWQYQLHGKCCGKAKSMGDSMARLLIGGLCLLVVGVVAVPGHSANEIASMAKYWSTVAAQMVTLRQPRKAMPTANLLAL